MGLVESLGRYFDISPRPQLSPEELAERRILSEVLTESGAPELLINERNNKGIGWEK